MSILHKIPCSFCKASRSDSVTKTVPHDYFGQKISKETSRCNHVELQGSLGVVHKSALPLQERNRKKTVEVTSTEGKQQQ
eukprot:c43226_g1_i1 orf=252-491(+)